MVFINGNRNDELMGRITLSTDEARQLASDLTRAIDECVDHQCPFPVTLVSSRDAKNLCELYVTPFRG